MNKIIILQKYKNIIIVLHPKRGEIIQNRYW